jgi:hypothetical protein
MRKLVLALALPLAVAAFPTPAFADSPFPAPKVLEVFVAAQTVTPDRAVITQVAPGGTVIFRAYAVDAKTKKVMTAKDVKYFYVTIPNQPNVKLTYNPQAPGATAKMAWTGRWTVPSTYSAGIVGFKILIKIDAKRHGQFVQMPVATAQLTVTSNPSASFVAPIAAVTAAAQEAKLDVGLYVDSVNGTRPAGAAPRPTGCTQTNVYKRGEQFVVRAWGSNVATGDILTSDNVDTATVAFVGVAAPLTMNWGAHGAADNRVLFWTAAWNIPADYPLGDSVARVTFKTDDGKTGIFDYAFTVIP